MENKKVKVLLSDTFDSNASLDSWTNDAPPDIKMPEDKIVLPHNGNRANHKRVNTYFITLNLSINSRVYSIHNNSFGLHFWYQLTQDEQYNAIKYWYHKLHKDVIISNYTFFEQTRDGNIHTHSIIETNCNMKDIKVKFFDVVYACASHPKLQKVKGIFRYFLDVKVFDKSKWNDYQHKKDNKGYQTTSYDPICYNTIPPICTTP